MRIVGGAHRGLRLVAPKGQSTRPTADKTRQAMFNILEHAPWAPDLTAARVADLYAGSGALGLEALSRGAAFCLFLDIDASALGVVSRNLHDLGLESQGATRRWDARRLGPWRGAPFQLVFLDPPYGQGLVEPGLACLLAGGWLAAEAVVAVERGAAEPPLAAPGFQVLDARGWGAARVWFLAPAAPGPWPIADRTAARCPPA